MEALFLRSVKIIMSEIFRILINKVNTLCTENILQNILLWWGMSSRILSCKSASNASLLSTAMLTQVYTRPQSKESNLLGAMLIKGFENFASSRRCSTVNSSWRNNDWCHNITGKITVYIRNRTIIYKSVFQCSMKIGCLNVIFK